MQGHRPIETELRELQDQIQDATKTRFTFVRLDPDTRASIEIILPKAIDFTLAMDVSRPLIEAWRAKYAVLAPQSFIQRAGDWIFTHSGLPFWPHDPHASDVRIADIGWHLAHLCRYTGAVSAPYSVGEHSLHVERIVSNHLARAMPADRDIEPLMQLEDATARLQALLHDGTEAYVNDLNAPTKRLLQDYQRCENGIWTAICQAFDIPEGKPNVLRVADMIAGNTEARDLLPPHPCKSQPKISDSEVLRGGVWPEETYRKFVGKANDLRQRIVELRTELGDEASAHMRFGYVANDDVEVSACR